MDIFVKKYLKIKENAFHFVCFKIVQLITLITGFIVFFINKESILITLLIYFILEIASLKYQPIQQFQELIETYMNNHAGLLKQKARQH